jgi:hypothetical protein
MLLLLRRLLLRLLLLLLATAGDWRFLDLVSVHGPDLGPDSSMLACAAATLLLQVTGASWT